MRILFIGVPRFALELAQAGHTLAAVVLPYLDDDGAHWKLMEWAHQQSVPILPPHSVTEDASHHHQDFLKRLAPVDLLLVMSFHRRVATWVCVLARMGAWNVHASLLPRHRGYNPYYWTVRTGDTVAGVTVHGLTERFDAGPVVWQRSCQVPAKCTSGQLAELLNNLSTPTVLDAIAALQRGQLATAEPQDESAATTAPQPSLDQLTVNPTRAAGDIVRHICAATPDPGARLMLLGRTWVVRGAVLGPMPSGQLTPGTPFLVQGKLFVACAGGSFRPLTVEHANLPVDLTEEFARQGGPRS
jgi:methionyl-tRNA formyltransferase